MIKEQLSKNILEGKVGSVFANLSMDFRDRPSTDFDNALSGLCEELRKILPSIRIKANGSFEQYEIDLSQIPVDKRPGVIHLFQETEIHINSEHHIPGLF